MLLLKDDLGSTLESPEPYSLASPTGLHRPGSLQGSNQVPFLHKQIWNSMDDLQKCAYRFEYINTDADLSNLRPGRPAGKRPDGKGATLIRFSLSKTAFF